MRDGYKVFDADTHVDPSAEVLERYVDPSFRSRLAELEPYRVARGTNVEGQPRHVYQVGRRTYQRELGKPAPLPQYTGGDSGAARGTQKPAPGVRDDNADGRIKDMDQEGVDANLMVPGAWYSVQALEDPSLDLGLIRAYHRYMNDFCSPYPDRLKGLLVVSGRSIEDAVTEIRAWGKSRWAVAVWPFPGMDKPLDHPDLEPVWAVAQEHDLAIVHHSSTWNPPYFPRYRDLWDNIFLGRSASHPWGAMRAVAAFIGAGIMDRYPTLRFGILEC